MQVPQTATAGTAPLLCPSPRLEAAGKALLRRGAALRSMCRSLAGDNLRPELRWLMSSLAGTLQKARALPGRLAGCLAPSAADWCCWDGWSTQHPACASHCCLQLDTEVMMHVTASDPGGGPLPSPALYMALLGELEALAGTPHLAWQLEGELPQAKRATAVHCCLEALLGQVCRDAGPEVSCLLAMGALCRTRTCQSSTKPSLNCTAVPHPNWTLACGSCLLPAPPAYPCPCR